MVSETGCNDDLDFVSSVISVDDFGCDWVPVYLFIFEDSGLKDKWKQGRFRLPN